MTDFSIDVPPFTACFNALHHKCASRPTKGRPGRIFFRVKALKIYCDGGDSMVKSGKKINPHLSDSVYDCYRYSVLLSCGDHTCS